MLRRTQDPSFETAFVQGHHLALPIGLEQIGTKLVTKPQMITHHLDGFDVKIGTRQVTP